MAAEAGSLPAADLTTDGGNRLNGEPALSAPDLYTVLAERLDVTRWRPSLAPKVEVAEFEMAGGGRYFMAANPDRSAHYRLTPDEAALLPRLDGCTTVGELVVDRLADRGELDAGAVVELVRLLEAGDFLSGRRVDVYAVLERALHPPTLLSRMDRVLRTLTVEWSGAENMIRGIYRRVLRYAFNPLGVVAAVAVSILGVVAFAYVTSTHHFSLTNRRFGVAFCVLLALDLAIIFVHEMGHATVLVHYGRRVRGAGFRIYFGAPSFFIESSDGLMLPTRRRIFQSAAGPVFEAVGTSVAAIALWVFPTGATGRTLYQFVIMNYFVLFLNLVPMLELDGYWILSDALHQPDLRPESLAFVRREMWRKLRRRERFSRREVGLAAFGLAGVVFTVFALWSAWFFWRRVFGDTIVTMWRGGWEARLLLLVLVLLLGGPAIRLGVVAARSAWGRVRALVDRVRFRLETSWRVEAASLLDDSGLFGDVPVEVLNDLAGRFRLRTLAPGAVLIRQGDPAEAFYMVRSGNVEVVEEHPDGRTRTLAVEGRGTGIGDQGLVEGSPRAATVRSVGRAELFEIDKATFDRLLTCRAARPSFAPTVQRIEELRRLGPFTALPARALADLARSGAWVHVAPGEVLFRQGDAGDAFYVIEHGRMTVDIHGTVVAELGPGDHVGEMALLLDAPRSATVTAMTGTRLFAIDRGGFDDLIAEQFRHGAIRPAAAVPSIRDH